MIVSSVLAVAFIAAGTSAQTSTGCTPAVQKYSKCVGATPSVCLTDTCSEANTGGDDFKNTMLSKHLYYRKQAYTNGSRGADMMNLEWDDQLAAGAMAWVQRLCSLKKQLEHDANTCRITARYSSVGQNLAWGKGTNYPGEVESANIAVDGWYNEIKDQLTERMFPFNFTSATGHYTAVVWSRSYKFGCAMVVQIRPSEHERWIACNYSPTGNMGGMKWNVFNPGNEPAENCRTNTKKGSSGLCEVIPGQEEAYRKDVMVADVS